MSTEQREAGRKFLDKDNTSVVVLRRSNLKTCMTTDTKISKISGELHDRADIILYKRPLPPEYYNSNQQNIYHKSTNTTLPVKIAVDQHITFNKKTSEDISSKRNLGLPQFFKCNKQMYMYECLPCNMKGIGACDILPHLCERRHRLEVLTWKVSEKGLVVILVYHIRWQGIY